MAIVTRLRVGIALIFSWLVQIREPATTFVGQYVPRVAVRNIHDVCLYGLNLSGPTSAIIFFFFKIQFIYRVSLATSCGLSCGEVHEKV